MIPFRPFTRMINSVKRLEKHYDECVLAVAAQKAAAEHYAALWNDLKIELHKARVRIKRLEAELESLK